MLWAEVLHSLHLALVIVHWDILFRTDITSKQADTIKNTPSITKIVLAGKRKS